MDNYKKINGKLENETTLKQENHRHLLPVFPFSNKSVKNHFDKKGIKSRNFSYNVKSQHILIQENLIF